MPIWEVQYDGTCIGVKDQIFTCMKDEKHGMDLEFSNPSPFYDTDEDTNSSDGDHEIDIPRTLLEDDKFEVAAHVNVGYVLNSSTDGIHTGQAHQIQYSALSTYKHVLGCVSVFSMEKRFPDNSTRCVSKFYILVKKSTMLSFHVTLIRVKRRIFTKSTRRSGFCPNLVVLLKLPSFA